MPINADFACKDCKHSFTSLGDKIFSLGFLQSHHYKCIKSFVPAHDEMDPVVGKKRVPKEYKSCAVSRINRDICGPDAKNWSPKHKKDLFKMLTKEHHD